MFVTPCNHAAGRRSNGSASKVPGTLRQNETEHIG
jgi:hypothetical protein